jgi:hypothetical protein
MSPFVPTLVKEIGHAAVYLACSGMLSNRTFVLNGSQYRYFYHRCNNTCETERCVEIPVAWAFLERCRACNVLEIGNVLNHYGRFQHTVVDKYQTAEGVLNIDVQDLAPGQKHDAIISISTLEHVGWDEEPFDPGKAICSIERLREMLNPSARMLFSFPIGHNARLDQAIVDGTLGCCELLGMKRVRRNTWVELPVSELVEYRLEPAYRRKYGECRRVRAVVFAYFGSRN